MQVRLKLDTSKPENIECQGFEIFFLGRATIVTYFMRIALLHLMCVQES